MKRLAGIVALACVGLAAGLWTTVWLSHPVLDGTIDLAGLDARVEVGRDAYGVPVVTASSRRDLALATGFIHAQERFFQMDLLRRIAAGELSALVGRAALGVDRDHRLHRFRAAAEQLVTVMPAG
ncbi:MAG: penicillin acylase family protein, partial [Gammaproteobacteria bacterium]|nr:penicillin acylase family protein [Gammaproteobacteria bacterium]